jgi:hypothetical protein
MSVLTRMAAPDRVDAAARAGDPARAAAWTGELAPLAARSLVMGMMAAR